MKVSKTILMLMMLGLAAILILLFGHFTSAAPNRYIWQATIMKIEPKDYTNLVQDGDAYSDDEENVNVNVGYVQYIAAGAETYWIPRLSIEIFPGRAVGFQNLELFSTDGTSGNYCQFSDCGSSYNTWPLCLKNFLETYNHPYNGYKRVLISHLGDCYLTKEEADITKMEIHETRPLRSFSILIEGQDVYGDCAECQPNCYHNVEIKTGWMDRDPVGSIVRTGENTWNITISTFVAGGTDEFEGIFERYCQCIPAAHGKKPGQKSIITSAVAAASINYVIEFERVKR